MVAHGSGFNMTDLLYYRLIFENRDIYVKFII